MPLSQGGRRDRHLEMKDASIALLEALAVGNHSVEDSLVESERGNGSQEPTVPWEGKTLVRLALQICPREGGSVYAEYWGPPGIP